MRVISGRSITNFAAFAAILLLVFSTAGQTIADLESVIAAHRSQLTDKATTPEQQESILRQMASRSNHIGDLRYTAGEYELASEAFVQADAMLRRSHAIAYERKKKQLDEGESLLAGFSKDPDPEVRPIRERIGRTLVSIYLSDVLSEAEYFGDVAAQRKYLARFTEIARANGDVADEAKGLEKIGTIEFEAGKSELALELWAKARELRKTTGRFEWWTLDRIAATKWYLGDLDGAIEDYREIVSQTQKLEAEPFVIPPGASEGKIDTLRSEREVVRMRLTQALLNIAQINATRGNYGAAGDAVAESQEVVDVMLRSETNLSELTRSVLALSRASAEANMLRMHGRLLEARGDEAGAATAYAESAGLFSQLSGGAPSGAVAGLRVRLAVIYRNQGRFDNARSNIREALRIRTRLMQESGVAYALIQSSHIELAAKQFPAASHFAEQAKASAQRTKLDDVIAEAAEVEADVAMARGTASDPAITGYRMAVEVYKKADLRPALARAADSLGMVYQRIGKLTEAEAAYKQAIMAAEQMRSSFTTSEESDSFSDRGDITGIYQRLVDLLVKQGRIEEALQYATRAQRRDLVDATPINNIQLNGPGADAIARLVAADQREQAARSSQTGQSSGLSESMSPGKTNTARAVAEARADYAEAAKQLEAAVPGLNATVRPADLKAMQASLGSREAAISYLVTSETLFIFVVRHNAISARPVQVSRNTLRALIGRTSEGLKAFSQDFYDLSSDADAGFAIEKARPDLRIDDRSEYYRKHLAPVNSSLRTLYQRMIAPVEDLVSDAETLRIIPNAELFLLPIAALISPNNKYLIEKHALAFATAGDINAPRKTQAGNMLVAFGNPTEANLDGTLEEVSAIRKVFRNSRLYTGDKATKEQLFKLTSAKILHFATHGHIRSPAQKSTIQLAHLPNLKEPDLSYGEIRTLPVKATDMIVLSACETALGGVSGTEAGVFIEAFRSLTNSVAASLWSVDDLATRTLMVEFYKQLAAGRPRSVAMREAQLKVLRDGRTKNPLFWAPFVLYGEGGKLTTNGRKAR